MKLLAAANHSCCWHTQQLNHTLIRLRTFVVPFAAHHQHRCWAAAAAAADSVAVVDAGDSAGDGKRYYAVDTGSLRRHHHRGYNGLPPAMSQTPRAILDCEPHSRHRRRHPPGATGVIAKVFGHN